MTGVTSSELRLLPLPSLLWSEELAIDERLKIFKLLTCCLSPPLPGDGLGLDLSPLTNTDGDRLAGLLGREGDE